MDSVDVRGWIEGAYTGLFAFLGLEMGGYLTMVGMALLGWNAGWVATRQIRVEHQRIKGPAS